MIFKKPYGFLIKHFKLIHLILTGLFIYLTVITSNILDYYNRFISGSAGKLEAINYVNNNYLIAIVLSIVICLIVYALLRYKNKPRVLYFWLIGFVILVGVMVNMAQGGLEVIYFSVMDAKSLRLYRDLLRILSFFQYISIGVVLVRGLGFDIKKFDFVADMHELGLDVSDEEEVELTLGNTETVQRKFNRKLRELRYYYLENKAFILVIILVLLVIGGGGIFVKKEFIDKEYNEGEVFNVGQFNFKVIDSFVSKRGYDNQVITKNGDTFVVVRAGVSSNGEKKKLNDANVVLEVNNNTYASGAYYGNSFKDLGIPYRNQLVGEYYTYLFIYKISDEDIGKKMKLIYGGDFEVDLQPVMLDEDKEVKNYKLGSEIDFSSTKVSSGKFNVSSMDIQNNFTYPYQYEFGGQIYNSEYNISSTQGVIMKLDININNGLELDNYTFFKNYVTIKYKVNDEVKDAKIISDKTPGNEKNSLYLAVDKGIMDAGEVWLDIQIRNYKYNYKLK